MEDKLGGRILSDWVWEIFITITEKWNILKKSSSETQLDLDFPAKLDLSGDVNGDLDFSPHNMARKSLMYSLTWLNKGSLSDF